MLIDTQAIQAAATLSAPMGALPKADSGAAAARWISIGTTILAVSGVLLASGLAVVLNLS
jgi:hypothetical protein